jgi:hypothetical protein
LYYGSREIIYGPQGVDLSNFSSVEKNVKRAVERILEDIINWLVKAFAVDLEHQCLSVMALINRSEHVYWERVPLEGTPQWRNFIRRVGLAVKCMKKLRMCIRGKVMKKENKKRRKKGILMVMRHLEVMLSLVLLIREKETQK